MHSRLKKYLYFNNPENLIYICTASAFLHFYITALCILLFSVAILSKKSLKKDIFCHKSSAVIIIFTVFSAVTALCCRNFFGFGASVLFFLMFIIALYMRTVMTAGIFEKATTICCFASLFASFVIIVEKIINIQSNTHRCFGDFANNLYTSFYLNPNYVATLMAIVIFICAYKILTYRKNILFFSFTAFFAAVSMYLCGSMFIWIVVIAGLAVYLFTAHHRKLLTLLFGAALTGIVLLILFPEIMPRINEIAGTSDNRFLIWGLTVDKIPESILFGRGFYSYYHISNILIASGVQGIYSSTHAHNIILESLLSFGIVGLILIITGMFIFFKRLSRCMKQHMRPPIATLIFTIFSALILHSFIDMTMLWIQTGLLYCIIFSGIGAYEKTQPSGGLKNVTK